MKNTIIIIVLIIVIIAAVSFSVYYLIGKPTIIIIGNVNIANVNIANVPYANIKVENEVIIKDASFNPSVITIKKGKTVTWTNQDAYTRWVITDPHPKHDKLPGLDSGKLIQGQSWSYTFNQVGEWPYHDELNPIKKGIVIVEQ